MECASTPGRMAVQIGVDATVAPPGAQNWFTRLLSPPHERIVHPVEVYGAHEYRQVLRNGWIATLIRQPHGWSFRLYDKPPELGGVDLSSVTPPFGGSVPNTRDISGWHFRNAANTGPNTGDVNAPQHLRPFAFSRNLVGTAGIKPSSSGASPKWDTADAEGRGWLRILDMGLADLQAGEQARLNYLRLEGCLTWPEVAEALQDTPSNASQTDPQTYTQAEYERLYACGLSDAYELRARVLPRLLEVDLDGDGSLDTLAQLRHRATGKQDVGLCRGGTWFALLSDVSPAPAYLQGLTALEQWRVVDGDFSAVGAPGGETTWPQADGDVVVLERLEKSMHLLFMQAGGVQVQRVFRFVEP